MGELTIDDSRAADGRRSAVVAIGNEQFEIFLERCDAELATICADAFVLATVTRFMLSGEPMHVSAPVTRRLLAGLEEWQRAWGRWRPGTIRPVEVTADEVLVGFPTSPHAVTSFTGGVDSTYTVWRHTSGAAGNATVDLRAALFVHGFDIPLDDRDGFEASCRRSATYLDRTGLQLIPMRTDLRAIGYDWRDEHGLAVAAALSALAPDFGIGLVAATAPYHSEVIRWGSNPLTDPLTSSGMMDIRYDGADASRVEKIGALVADPEAIAQLRFCWETEPHDENCGVCAKCIHTATGFLANGIEHAACFTRWPTIEEIGKVPIATPGTREGFGWVLEAAVGHGRGSEPWAVALSERLNEAN